MPVTKEEIKAMSKREKQQLLEMIWESFEEINDKPYSDTLPVESEDELQLLKERMEDYKKDPASAKPWSEAYKELKKKYE